MNERRDDDKEALRVSRAERLAGQKVTSDEVMIRLIDSTVKAANAELRRDLNGSLHDIKKCTEELNTRLAVVEREVARFEPAVVRIEKAAAALELSRRAIVAIIASGGVSGFALLEFLLRA